MSGKQKVIVGIFGVSVMLIIFIFFTVTASIGFYISRHGDLVDATIIDASEVCRSKNKSITVRIGEVREKLRIYGPSCRNDEFIQGRVIRIRYSKRFNQYALPDNINGFRLIFFTLLSVLVLVAFILLIRDYRKKF